MSLGRRGQKRTQVMPQWMLRAIVSTGSLLAILEWTSLTPTAEDRLSSHVMRPPDTRIDPLERPRPEQEAPTSVSTSARLRQSDVVALAKTLARKELGRSYDDYDLRAPVFDPMTQFWSVTFVRSASHRVSEACLLVLINDESREATSRPCS